MVEEKKGFCFIYLKRTHHLPSVVKFYKPVEKQTVSFAYSPLQRGGLFFFPSFFLWFSQEIHYKRIERQSFGHLERFTNNQHWPFLGVKSHFDTAKSDSGDILFLSMVHHMVKPNTLLPASSFRVSESMNCVKRQMVPGFYAGWGRVTWGSK